MYKEGLKLIKDNKRIDGRAFDELRKPLRLEVGVLPNANGSAYIEWGGNKIVVAVYGPSEVLPKHLENPFRGTVKAYYMMSTFSSLEEHGRAGPTRRSLELSKVIGEALEHIIFLEKIPATQIEVYILVLQAEGGTRVASLTAAVAALMDAGIPIREPAVAVASGKVDGTIVLDIGKEEDNYGEADVPVGFTKSGEIILLQADGKLTKEEFKKAIEMSWNASKTLFNLQREAIVRKYQGEVNISFDM